MKERPILFRAPMVRALLDGTKTQTRRICRPAAALSFIVNCGAGKFGDEEGDVQFTCPYGQPDDRLWVREAILRPRTITTKLLRDGADTWPRCVYRADGGWYGRNDPMMSVADAQLECGDFVAQGWRGYPSIHMPRWASRITLEVTSVRVERLQAISDCDARAEGISSELPIKWLSGDDTPRGIYGELWESISGAGSWDANPWVWVIEFARVTP